VEFLIPDSYRVSGFKRGKKEGKDPFSFEVCNLEIVLVFTK
jgi:hypothetical protein